MTLLAGRVALVTGASRGIGAATAIALAGHGAHVVLTARTQGGLEETDDAIRAAGGTATLLPLDLTKPENLDPVGPSLLQRFGRLDILVHNAGVLGKLTPAGHITPKDMEACLQVNFLAAWRLIRTCGPVLAASDAGRAVFVTSSVARTPRAFWGAYAASKAAMESIVRCWADEVENTPPARQFVRSGCHGHPHARRRLPRRRPPHPETRRLPRRRIGRPLPARRHPPRRIAPRRLNRPLPVRRNRARSLRIRRNKWGSTDHLLSVTSREKRPRRHPPSIAPKSESNTGMPTTDERLKAAATVTSKIDADIYLYNGPISRGYDLSCILEIAKHAGRKNALLLLVTTGGDPDAAYKISRYLQDKYEQFTVLVSGLCKSAGTLIALGAHELSFMPFGELGPLDIQLGKVDKFDSPQSGLAIQEALDTLESRARKSFDTIIADYMQDNGGLLSFPAASQSASDFVMRLYAPILARIDPEEVGERSRSMRIAHEYGKRLALGSQNLKNETLSTLAEKYPSHSFVIDRREAENLFYRVRAASPAERALVECLGEVARFPGAFDAARKSSRALLFRLLSSSEQPAKETARAKADPRTGEARNGAHSPTDARPAKPVAKQRPQGSRPPPKERQQPPEKHISLRTPDPTPTRSHRK